MNLPKLIADIERLLADVKAATEAAGPDGKKINPAEWGRLAKDGLAVAGDLVGVVAAVSALA